MRIIDMHIHMYSRTTDDCERMRRAGIEADFLVALGPAFEVRQGRPGARAVGSRREIAQGRLPLEGEPDVRHVLLLRQHDSTRGAPPRWTPLPAYRLSARPTAPATAAGYPP